MMTAREYLRQSFKADRHILMLIREKDDLRAMAFSAGSSSGQTGERVQSSHNPDKLGELFAKIDEKEREITQEIDALVDLKALISERIRKIEDPRLAEVLHCRYVLLMSWDAAADAMHYDRSNLTRKGGLEDQALAAFARYNPDVCDPEQTVEDYVDREAERFTRIHNETVVI